jgi:small-conductance mechanosensitive channel
MTLDGASEAWPLLDQGLQLLPTLLGVIGVLLVGVVVALVARWLVSGVVSRSGLEALAERAGVSRALYFVGLKSGLARVVGNLTAVAVLVATLAVLADFLGLSGLALGLGAIVDYLPDLVVAAGLTLLAFVGADFASRLVEQLGQSRSDLVSPRLGAALAYWAVLIVGLSMAVRQLGVETALFETLLSIVIGSVVVAFTSIVAWSSRHVIAGVINRQYTRRHVHIGDRIRVGDVEGVVEEHDTLSTVLRVDDGTLALLPSRRLVDEVVEILERRD